MWKRWRTETVRWSAFFLIVAAIVIAFIAGLLWNSNSLKTARNNSSQLQYQLSLSEDNRDKLEDKLKSVGSKAYISYILQDTGVRIRLYGEMN